MRHILIFFTMSLSLLVNAGHEEMPISGLVVASCEGNLVDYIPRFELSNSDIDHDYDIQYILQGLLDESSQNAEKISNKFIEDSIFIDASLGISGSFPYKNSFNSPSFGKCSCQQVATVGTSSTGHNKVYIDNRFFSEASNLERAQLISDLHLAKTLKTDLDDSEFQCTKIRDILVKH